MELNDTEQIGDEGLKQRAILLTQWHPLSDSRNSSASNSVDSVSLSDLEEVTQTSVLIVENGNKQNFPTKPSGRYSHQCKVYVSHFLSSWGDRMWAFAGGLFLIELTPGSLRLLAFYTASLSLTIVFFGSGVGRWVDTTKRLRAAQTSLVLQNSMVCICTALLCLLIQHSHDLNLAWNGWAMVFGQVAIVGLACVAQVGTLASKISIEKDWIVVISGTNHINLSTMNSVMRTIDLSTKMLAPVLVGFVMSFWGTTMGGVVIAVWNVVSMTIEYGLLRNLYFCTPELRKPKTHLKSTRTKETESLLLRVKDAADIWRRYFRHKVKLAGLALAFLYMTVLALDNYTVAYVYESGVSKAVLGIVTAVGSLTGICGSILFPILQKRLGTLRTGLFGFIFELSCLTFCVASMFAPGTLFEPAALLLYSSSDTQTVQLSMNGTDESVTSLNSPEKQFTSVILLLVGIVTSRLGLWLADLTVTQILQTEVAVGERGGINGVQSSLNQMFSLIRSLLLILIPTMATYGYLVGLSFLFVATACVLFFLYTRQLHYQISTYESESLIQSNESDE